MNKWVREWFQTQDHCAALCLLCSISVIILLLRPEQTQLRYSLHQCWLAPKYREGSLLLLRFFHFSLMTLHLKHQQQTKLTPTASSSTWSLRWRIEHGKWEQLRQSNFNLIDENDIDLWTQFLMTNAKMKIWH